MWLSLRANTCCAVREQPVWEGPACQGNGPQIVVPAREKEGTFLGPSCKIWGQIFQESFDMVLTNGLVISSFLLKWNSLCGNCLNTEE